LLACPHFNDATTTALDHGQPEHALESRVLSGNPKVTIQGTALQLLTDEPLVARGSQFPTQWRRDGGAKYLDALLKDGSTPWAVELKCGGNTGAYYRHGIAQAVLYRHFIRTATPTHEWFRAYGLEPQNCRAALAFPTPKAKEVAVES